MDTSARMQYDADHNYYDPYDYTRRQPVGHLARRQRGCVEVSAGSTRASSSRRPARRSIRPSTITAVGNQASQAGRLQRVLREDPARRRQSRRAAGDCREHEVHEVRPDRHAPGEPRVPSPLNDGEVQDDDAGQSFPTDGSGPGLWKVTRAIVDANNGRPPRARRWSNRIPSSPNTDIATILNRALTASGAVLPAGNDSVDRSSMRRSRTCSTTSGPKPPD